MTKYNLLYVDDEPSNLRIFKDTFRRNFNIFTAASAKEGIDIMDKHRIDLILSDQRMPEMTGVELLKYSFNKYPHCNRILITGYSDIKAVEDALNHARVFQYVQKPWKEKDLFDIISDALRVQELEQENDKQRKELEASKLKAEESDRLKTEFIYNMSHEVRTPMNGIIGFSTLLENVELTECEKQEYIKIIKNSSNQLLRIIDDILEISQLATSQVEPHIVEVSINNLLSELHAIFSIKALKQNIEFTYNPGLSNEESSIMTDRSRLYIIVSNLLDNAFKFTREGNIELGYQVNNNSIDIWVNDTGIGINNENFKNIFDRFSQEEKDISSKTGGLGLGLSIAEENAKIIDGKITVQSQKGTGSKFTISIPFNRPTIEETEQVEDNPITRMNKELKILVAEDEDINYLYIETVIKKCIDSNITVLHAINGAEAVRICEQNMDIDLVFMDIKMPIMDGYEATQKIKALRPELPVVAQTAYSSHEDRFKAQEAGCDEFISKPIDKDILNCVLNRFIYSRENAL